MKRFNERVIAENQITSFCSEKQVLDKLTLQGGTLPPTNKSIPLKGQPIYKDPWNQELEYVKQQYALNEEAKQIERKAWEYQEALKTIPQVDYYPTTILREMKKKSNSMNSSNTRNTAATTAKTTTVRSTTPFNNVIQEQQQQQGSGITDEMNAAMDSTWNSIDGEKLSSQYPDWMYAEENFHLSLKLAQKGDRQALFDLNIRKHLSPRSKFFTATSSPVGRFEDEIESSSMAFTAAGDMTTANFTNSLTEG
jgi:hypothetical protein